VSPAGVTSQMRSGSRRQAASGRAISLRSRHLAGGSLPFRFSTENMPTSMPREPPVTTYPWGMVQSVAKSSFSMTPSCSGLRFSSHGVEIVGAYCMTKE